MAGLDRRTFLAGLVATVGAAACGGSDGGSGGEAASGTTRPGTVATAAPPPPLSGPPFTLGVASGDPLADRVVLWTRLAPDPLGDGGMPDEPVDVAWEVARDDGFAEVVRSGVATAVPALAHSVHVDADGLEPDTWYHYRFRVGEHTSPVGRTRTFPAAGTSPERMRLAVANCQGYQFGRYAAYRHMAGEDLDAVLFLGDYIYELPGVDDPERALAERNYVGGVPETVEDFRRRYAITQMDEDLAAAHRAAPWIVTFDDHEVVNNYAGDDGALVGSGPEFLARRAAAYQAWYEHLPLRIEPPDDDGMVRVHREARFGDLARLLVIETRQHADPPPCRETSLLDEGPGCAEQDAEDRTALGAEQADWLDQQLGGGDEATWQVLASPVLLAGLDIAAPGEPPAFYLETWDGYAAERRRVVAALAGARNPVVLSGDYHASFVADVHLEPRDRSTPVVAPELLATAISSVPFATDHTAGNPHVRYFEARNGYLACEVTADAITAEFRYVDDVADAASPVATAATFVVTPSADAGAPTVERA